MASIHFLEVPPEEREYLKNGPLRGHALRFYEEAAGAAPPRALRGAEVLSVFIYSRVTAAMIKAMPRLRLVATRSTGFDHVDLAACRRRGVAVVNVPTYGENTVAEHTFALILALSRKVHQAYFRTIRGDFSFKGLQGFDLKGKTIGVVGTGHIGLHAIRIASGFGMKVLAYDPFRNRLMAETLGFEYASFDEVLAQSDILTLHAPYNPQTHHMINRGNIGRIKRGALLINTARGGLVETQALVSALDQGILCGAGLDVLEGEDLIVEEKQVCSRDFPADKLRMMLQNHILLNRENVVITPHIAFNSREAFQRILDTTVSNIQAFLAGAPENLVGGAVSARRPAAARRRAPARR
jgi:D-lactate dehydrogenase